MDAKIRETAEKIYVENVKVNEIAAQLTDEEKRTLEVVSERCIAMAKVFHSVCGKDLVRVEK